VTGDDRLDSWKEIAAYLKRGVRTAQRWERKAGLPVRHIGSDGRTVFAFRSELDAWWRGRTPSTGSLGSTSGRAAAEGVMAPAPPESPLSTRVRPFLSQQVGIDTESATGHTSMAVYFFTLTAMGLIQPADGLSAARAASRRALDLDIHHAEAHAIAAVVSAHDARDWAAASRGFAHAFAREPVSPLVRFHYASWYLAPLERHEAALAQATAALADDPLYLIGRVQIALELIGLGQFDRGIAELRDVLRIDPHFGPALGHLGRELAILGALDEAMSLAERAVSVIPRHPNAVGFLSGMTRRAGQDSRSEGLIADLAATNPWARARAEAEAFIVCGRWDDALEAVAEASLLADPGIWILLSGQAGKALRRCRRWPSVRSTLNLPEA
jgi:Tfp pilus assembly protein PilF